MLISCLLPFKSLNLIHLGALEQRRIERVFQKKANQTLILESIQSIHRSKELIAFLFEFYKVA